MLGNHGALISSTISSHIAIGVMMLIGGLNFKIFSGTRQYGLAALSNMKMLVFNLNPNSFQRSYL
jgi:hypothetical protein